MARQGPPPEPKPFFWIPLDTAQAPDTDAPPDHGRFSGWSGRLDLEIEVRSDYLYVGSGNFDLAKTEDIEDQELAYYAFARRNGQLVIPATSIKGAVRSVLEAISNSCVPQVGRRERVPRSHEGCKDVKALCPACRLFGTTGYRGRVHFSDATPVEQIRSRVIKIADLWPPRQTKGRKFYQSKGFPRPADMKPQKSHRFIEAVRKGARFTTTLYFENLSTADMGLLIRALGMDRREEKTSSETTTKVVLAFPVKIGGAKPRCLGSVFFRPKGIRLLWGAEEIDLVTALRQGGVPPRSLITQILEWLGDDALLDRRAWETFLKEAKSQQGTCPREVY